MKRVIKWSLRILGGLVALALALAIAAYLMFDMPKPEGVSDQGADVLARRVQAAVEDDRWGEVEYIEWRFGGRRHHAWSRCAEEVTVTWPDAQVRLDLAAGTGTILRGEGDDLVETARGYFFNDAFWLYPMRTFFDAGVTRTRVALAPEEIMALGVQGEALMVTYASGGVTPGDTYLWLLDEAHRPVAWRMWVSILPIGGLKATWEDWQPLSEGPLVSRRHRLPFGMNVEITDVKTGACPL